MEEEGFHRSRLPYWETVFTIGNGYMGLRGSLEEGCEGSHPGTYIASVYDKGEALSSELVNAPNPLSLKIHVEGKPLSVDSMKVSFHTRSLNLKHAVLSRRTVFADEEGNRYEYASRRYVSMANVHLGVLEVEFASLDRDCNVTLRKLIDGGTANTLHPLNQPVKHYRVVDRHAGQNTSYLEAETFDSRIRIGVAVGVESSEKLPFNMVEEGDVAASECSFLAEKGRRYKFTFYFAVFTSRDPDLKSYGGSVKDACLAILRSAIGKQEAAFLSHKKAWEEKWETCQVEVDDDEVRNAVRFVIYHLLIAAPRGLDASIGAKALCSEWYGGHVFWDTEIYMLPFFLHTEPDTARSLLMYRYRRIGKAREKARGHGYDGAFWPWESALTGEDETPREWVDVDGKVVPVHHAEREIHICGDIVYAVWRYYLATGDLDFMLNAGLEIVFETARFWASRVSRRPDGKYELKCVTGPDEFHECVDNNAYTNFLARFTLKLGCELYERFGSDHPEELGRVAEKIHLQGEEVERWREIAENIVFPMDSNGLIEEFEGYFKLRDLRADASKGVPAWPESVAPSEARSTQLVKQADVVMLFHLFPDEFPPEVQRVNLDYYAERTVHASSLSPASYAMAYLNLGMAEEAYRYFRHALFIDLRNIYGNTFKGVHAASLGGSWQVVVHGFAGVRVKEGCLSVNPKLPRGINRIRFKFWYRGSLIEFDVKGRRVEARVVEGEGGVPIEHGGRRYTLSRKALVLG